MLGRTHKFLAGILCAAGFACGAARAQHTTETPPAFRELQQVEDRWDDAVAKRDQYQMELVLAPEFIGISASGDVTTRNQQIARIVLENAEPETLQQKVVSVRFVGEVAIVNGTYIMTWKGETAPILEKGIFSHVFAHVRSTWLCLNSQRTVVAEENDGGPQKKSKLPTVYKGPEHSALKP
jgi:Domain of unknown function (DUF4440)